jgi:hypothetical protein
MTHSYLRAGHSLPGISACSEVLYSMHSPLNPLRALSGLIQESRTLLLAGNSHFILQLFGVCAGLHPRYPIARDHKATSRDYRPVLRGQDSWPEIAPATEMVQRYRPLSKWSIILLRPFASVCMGGLSDCRGNALGPIVRILLLPCGWNVNGPHWETNEFESGPGTVTRGEASRSIHR